MGKYEPLSSYLKSQQVGKVSRTFEEIEQILGFELPKSAQEYEAWWSNNATGHSHARAWLDAGWKRDVLDLAGQEVTFVRAPAAAESERERRKASRYGCMRGTVIIYEGTDLTAPGEDEWNAEKGLLLSE